MLSRSSAAVLVALFNLVPLFTCFNIRDTRTNVEGFDYLGSYRSYNKIRQDFTDSDYFVSQGVAPWNTAETDCEDRFGTDEDEGGLLWFNTREELDYVAEMITFRFPGALSHWTGGVYVESRNVWIWAPTREDVPLWVPWKGGSPPTNVDSNSRMAIDVPNEFDVSVKAEAYTAVKQYICKREAYVVPTTPETTTPEPTTPEPTTPEPTTPEPTTPEPTTPEPTTPEPTTPEPTTPEPTTTTLSTSTTMKPVPVVPCYKTVDLELVLDSSGSIGIDNFQLALEYVANLTTAFTVHQESRVGYLTFSSFATSRIALTNVLSPMEIWQTIKATPYDAGNTYTNFGVDMATNSLVTYNRPPVERAMVTVTDGGSNDPAATAAAALRAKNLGIKMYAVGITTSPNEAELLKLAGDVPANVFHAYDWADLIPLLTLTSDHICPK